MTDATQEHGEYTAVDPIAWKQAFLTLKAAELDYRALNIDPDVDEAADACIRLHNAERALLALPAPDVSGVIEKLFLLFSDDLWNETGEAQEKLTAIGDLRRIEILNR